MKMFEELLLESAAAHGHLCAGQVIGVRMAMLGCRLLGIDDPRSPEWRKRLVVFVEIDRCATDAIESVTGCRMGRRSLKFRDYGINAATFVDLKTHEAVRIVSTEQSRQKAVQFTPDQSSAALQQLEGYRRMADKDLFVVQRVEVDLPPWEMPGPPCRRAVCARCGQVVRDGREVIDGAEVLCRPCAGEGYFRLLTSQDINRACENQEILS